MNSLHESSDDSIPNPTGPFVQVRQIGDIYFISGKRGIAHENNQLVDYDIDKSNLYDLKEYRKEVPFLNRDTDLYQYIS